MNWERTVKKRALAIFLAAFLAALAAAAPQAGAEEPGQRQLSEARLSVEQSSFTGEAKLGILTKADRAVAAGIPPEDVAVIITGGLSQGADSKTIVGFLEAPVQLKEKKLPVRMVLDRIEQGLAKGVPAERITAVAQKLSGSLAAARPMVEKLATGSMEPGRGGRLNDAVETTARALEKNISPDAIMTTGETVRERRGSIELFNRAVDAMAVFVGSGMHADQASRLVHDAVNKGYSERDFEAMERYMAGELRRNRPMNDVVSGMESRMESGSMRSGNGGMRVPGYDGMGGNGGMGGTGGMGGRR